MTRGAPGAGARITPRRACMWCQTTRAVSAHTGCCAECIARYAPPPLRLVLDAVGLSIRAAAQLLGVSERTISRAASGEPIGAAVAARIGRELRIDPAVLIAGIAPPASRGPRR